VVRQLGAGHQETVAISAFLEAAKAGDLETVRQRLDAGMPVDVTLPPKDPRHPYTVRTALEAASIYARMEVVALLLSRGATLRRDERYGIYAASLHWGEAPQLLAVLHEHAGPGADVDADFGPALVRGAANRAIGEVRYLLAAGVNPDWRSPHEPYDAPAIVRAGSYFEIVEMLLAAGADPTGGELPYPWSPLFPAASAADIDMTRRFLELGIDPHLQGKQGNAVSMAACRSPRTSQPTREAKLRTNSVVELLLEAGVDPNLSYRGRTPLRCAEDSHNAELAAMLEVAGGRSRENLWSQVKRSAVKAGIVLVMMLGGGM
jgi:ankyrin repeat protein